MGTVVGGRMVVLAAWRVIGAIIVPRPSGTWLIRSVDKAGHASYQLATKRIKDYRTRDRVLATEAAVILLAQLIAWLVVFFIGFALLFWPFVQGGIRGPFPTVNPAVWFIGNSTVTGVGQRVIEDCAGLTGLVVVTLQIAYLPTLYSAFNRRETDIALLNARAGVPSWGPELLARTHYALGSGTSTIDTLPDLYAQWERFAADVAESHTTYLPLVRFRSPRPLSSWVTGLLAVLDSAALILALSPKIPPEVPPRPCLRSASISFTHISSAMLPTLPQSPTPTATQSPPHQQF